VRSLLDLRGFASEVCEFNSCSSTSSFVIVKLSLPVCILIFITFPDPLVSVVVPTQQTLPFKQLHILYCIYSPVNIKRIHTRAE